MRRLLRLFLYLAAALAAAGAAAVALVLLMPQDRIAVLVAEEVEKATGRPLVIEGDVATSLWPVLGVETGPVRLGNAVWGEAPDLLSAAAVEIGVEILPLLSGEIRIRELRLVDPVVSLEIAADGRANWAIGSGAGASGASTPGDGTPGREALASLALPAAEIVNGIASFRDARSGVSYRVEALDLTAGIEAMDAALTLDAQGVWQGRRAGIEGMLSTPAALLAGEPVTVRLRAEGDFGSARFEGSLADLGAALPRVTGDYALDMADPKAALALLGRAPDDALAPLGPVALAGNVAVDGTSASLSGEGRAVWRGEPATVSLSLASGDATAAEPAARVSLRVDAAAIGRLTYDGEARLGSGLPALDGRLAAAIAAPAGAFAWATGGVAPEPLSDLGAASLDTALAFSAAGLRLDGTGSAALQGREVAITFRAEGGPDWTSGGPLTARLVADAPGLAAGSFDGRISLGDRPALAGPMSVTTPDLRALLTWATGSAPDAPPDTLGAASLAGRIDLSGERATLGGIDLRLDGTDARGEAQLAYGGPRPFLTATLEAGALDLTPFTGGGAASGPGPSGGATARGGWSSEPIDLSALDALDADVTVDASEIRAGELAFGRSQLRAILKDGRLDLAIRQIEAYGGAVTGIVSLASGGATTLSTDLVIDAVRLRPFLAALDVTDDLEGLGALKLRLNGQGRSMAELMRSLGGDGSVELTDGAILGVNLAALVRNLTGRTGDARTEFSAVSGSFDIEKGVLRNSDFAFLGPLLRVTGGGTVDIGARRLDLTLVPKAVATLTGQGGLIDAAGLSIFPLRVTGPWSNPRIAPDLTAAVGRLVTDPIGTADGLQSIITGTEVRDVPGRVLGAVTGDGADGSGTGSAAPDGGLVGGLLGAARGILPGGDAGTAGGTAAPPAPSEDGAAGQSPAPAPRQDSVTGLLGGLLGAIGGGERAGQRDAGTAPDATAPQPAPGEAETPAAGSADMPSDPVTEEGRDGAGALAPVTARRPAPRASSLPGTPPAPEETRQEQPPGEATPAPRAPDSTAAPGEEVTPPPRRTSPEEEAVRALGNILRGLGGN